jgi:hypothetical protein
MKDLFNGYEKIEITWMEALNMTAILAHKGGKTLSQCSKGKDTSIDGIKAMLYGYCLAY